MYAHLSVVLFLLVCFYFPGNNAQLPSTCDINSVGTTGTWYVNKGENTDIASYPHGNGYIGAGVVNFQISSSDTCLAGLSGKIACVGYFSPSPGGPTGEIPVQKQAFTWGNGTWYRQNNPITGVLDFNVEGYITDEQDTFKDVHVTGTCNLLFAVVELVTIAANCVAQSGLTGTWSVPQSSKTDLSIFPVNGNQYIGIGLVDFTVKSPCLPTLNGKIFCAGKFSPAPPNNGDVTVKFNYGNGTWSRNSAVISVTGTIWADDNSYGPNAISGQCDLVGLLLS